MLVIRDRQLFALEKAALPQWLARHLRRHFPDECQALGATGLAAEIRYGLDRAAAHGFLKPPEAAQYLDLMFTFGRDFDRDPDLPWAAGILADRSREASIRMDALREAGLAFLAARSIAIAAGEN